MLRRALQKIHLDASMACGGEPHPSFEQVAERSAELCAVAEEYAQDPNQLLYIIGTANFQELIKQGALHKNDGDQFNDQVEEKE